MFARHGAHVVVADISETVLEGGEPTVKLIAREGGSASFRKTDVSDATAVVALVADTSRLTGQLDVIVNNACIRHARRLAELEEGDWDRMIAVNLKGVFLCCRAAVRQMLTQEIRNEARGRIIQSLVAARDDRCA